MKKVKLQYYLRGLGVGILVTSLIMGTMLSGKEKELTDAEIKKRATELGMVDENSLVLSDLQGDQFVKVDSADSLAETVELETEEVQTESVETPESSGQEEDLLPETEAATTEDMLTEESEETVQEESVVEENIIEEQGSESSEMQEQISQPRVAGAISEDGTTVTITIHSGANSYSVSKVLADTGLVTGAKSYDDFLCDGGYSKKIHTGNYVIPIGTSEEEIAKIITGNR